MLNYHYYLNSASSGIFWPPKSVHESSRKWNDFIKKILRKQVPARIGEDRRTKLFLCSVTTLWKCTEECRCNYTHYWPQQYIDRRSGLVVSITPRPLCPQGKPPFYPLYRRLGAPESQLVCYGEERTSCFCRESNLGISVVQIYRLSYPTTPRMKLAQNPVQFGCWLCWTLRFCYPDIRKVLLGVHVLALL
jgi:hypothetical protein